MKVSPIVNLFYLVSIAAILSGCASSVSHTSSDQREASHRPILETSASFPVRMLGLVDVFYDRDDTQQYFEAGFIEFVEAIDSDIVISMLKPNTATGCIYEENKTSPLGAIVTPEHLVFPHPHKRVTAGESLKVRYKGKHYVNLSYEKDNSGDYYEGGRGGQLISFNKLRIGEALLRSTSLSVTIPGDVFPAFENIDIPDEPKLRDLRVNHRHGLSTQSKVSWSNPQSTNTFVRFFAGGSGRALECILPDTGEFTPGDALRAQIGDSILHVVDAARERITFYREKDVLLAISHRSFMTAKKR